MSGPDEFADFQPAPAAAGGKDEFADFQPVQQQQQAPSPGMLSTLRALDQKYTGGMGRAGWMAARAPIDAAVSLASMPTDAVVSAYDYAKERAAGRPFSWNDLNPFSKKGGFQDPRLANNQIQQALSTVLPEPETTQEKIVHGLESFASGAAMPIPGAVGSSQAADLSGLVNGRGQPDMAALKNALSNKYQIQFNPVPPIPGAPKAGDTQRAKDIIENRLNKDLTNFDVASANVKADNAAGIPTRLTDQGPNTLSTGEVLTQKPGEASAIMTKDRMGIRADTKDRIGTSVRENLDAQGDVGAFSDALDRARSTNAKANYEAVRNDPQAVMDPGIWKILENPDVARVYQDSKNMNARVRSLDATMGKSTPPLADIYAPRVQPAGPPKYPNPEPGVIDTSAMRNPPEPPRPNEPLAPADPADQKVEWVRTGTAPDVRSLDFLQRALNTRIGQLYNQAKNGAGTQGGEGDLASALKTARSAIVDRLKELSPSFKKASETYGDDSEIIDAMQAGRSAGKESYFNMSPEQARGYYNGLSESGKSALRMGVADRMLATAEMSGRQTNLAADVLGGPRKNELVHILFDGDEQKYDLFRQAMQKEQELFNNNSKMMGGSQTYRRLEAGNDFSNESQLADKAGKVFTIGSQLSHHWMGAAVHGLIKMMQGATWNPSVASQASKILSSKDPQDAFNGLLSLEQSLTSGTTSNVGRAVTPAIKGMVGENSGDRLKDKYGVLPEVSQ